MKIILTVIAPIILMAMFIYLPQYSGSSQYEPSPDYATILIDPDAPIPQRKPMSHAQIEEWLDEWKPKNKNIGAERLVR